jgi:hypothetical protein
MKLFSFAYGCPQHGRVAKNVIGLFLIPINCDILFRLFGKSRGTPMGNASDNLDIHFTAVIKSEQIESFCPRFAITLRKISIQTRKNNKNNPPTARNAPLTGRDLSRPRKTKRPGQA